MKTVFNHRTAILSDVQPFGEFSNFQSLNSSMLLSGNYYCCMSLPLKITKGYRCRPLTEIYSIIIVYSHRPGSFLKVLRFSAIPNIRPLAPISYMRLVLSIFYRSAYITFLIAGRSKKRKLYLYCFSYNSVNTSGIYMASLEGFNTWITI